MQLLALSSDSGQLCPNDRSSHVANACFVEALDTPLPELLRKAQEQFLAERDSIFSSSYREAQLRIEFIDLLLESLGWDVRNSERRPILQREVVVERYISTNLDESDAGKLAPDYSIYFGQRLALIVEVKRPIVDITASAKGAQQVRTYGWNAKIPFAILTNFASSSIYDCSIEPKPNDSVDVGLVKTYSIDELETWWSSFHENFSRDAVSSGAIDALVASLAPAAGRVSVDTVFLAQLDSWRLLIAKSIADVIKEIHLRDLSYSTQLLLDRLIFLRIAEDRGLEPREQLLSILNSKSLAEEIKSLFARCSTKYGSELFQTELDPQVLHVEPESVRHVLRDLYLNPYNFAVMPLTILGSVYERYLGRILVRGKSGKLQLEYRPEVAKAGGVFYTSQPITAVIVQSAIAQQLAARTVEQVEAFSIIDISCGSGSFLVEAYSFLLAWYLVRYTSVERIPAKYRNRLVQDVDGFYALTLEERKRILLAHIYGVDLDAQAIEIAKLSLCLKLLEGDAHIDVQLRMLSHDILPDLSRNLVVGNSYLGLDYPSIFDPQWLDDLSQHPDNPFEPRDAFKKIFARENPGFDAVIGNPPYIDSELMTRLTPQWRNYCVGRYESASGNWDAYCVFIERGLQLSRSGGIVSMIVPNKLAAASYAAKTRAILVEQNTILEVRDYSALDVFPVAVYPIVFATHRGKITPRPPVPIRVMEDSPLSGYEIATEAVVGYNTYFRSEDPWPILSGVGGNNPIHRLKNAPTLVDWVFAIGGATVAEAYNLIPYIVEGAGADRLPLINSGVIDKYEIRWASKPTRYIKRSYQQPSIEARVLRRQFPSRYTQATTPKIIVAGMTRVIEAWFDERGKAVAAKSTLQLFPRTNVDLHLVLAILNSRVFSVLALSKFAGKRQQGGYLALTPDEITSLPRPTFEVHRFPAIAKLARQMQELRRLSPASAPLIKEVNRSAASIQTAIDNLVSRAYGVSDSERAFINSDEAFR